MEECPQAARKARLIHFHLSSFTPVNMKAIHSVILIFPWYCDDPEATQRRRANHTSRISYDLYARGYWLRMKMCRWLRIFR